MSFFNLTLLKKSDSHYILTVPLYSRIIVLLFALAVAMTFVIDPGFSLLPAVIIIILIITAMYRESWTFNTESNEVTSHFGLLILSRKTVVPFALIEKFQIEGFIKGSMTEKPVNDDTKKKKMFQTEYFKLSLINRNLGELTINTVKGRERDKLMEYARDIASLCKVPLHEI
jgi:hypothetical protein